MGTHMELLQMIKMLAQTGTILSSYLRNCNCDWSSITIQQMDFLFIGHKTKLNRSARRKEEGGVEWALNPLARDGGDEDEEE